jgi:hypothetical protein
MTLRRRRLSAIAAMLGIGIMLQLPGCAREPLPPPPPVSAAALPCPQWVEFPGDRHNGEGSPYLGCTSAFNLRAMVANPADLEHGRALGPADGERESHAIEAYRQGKIKAFEGSGASGSAASGSTGQ